MALAGVSAALALAEAHAQPVETIEAIGGQKCGANVRSYAVAFLAPEDQSLQARASLKGPGTQAVSGPMPRLALEGGACAGAPGTGQTDNAIASCTFRAKKGETYKITASLDEGAAAPAELCISVVRP